MASASANPVIPRPMRRARLLTLPHERVAGDIDHVIEESHGQRGRRMNRRQVEPRRGGVGVEHEGGEIERAEGAGPVGRQGFLGAGIGGAQSLTIIQIVLGIDAINKKNASVRLATDSPARYLDFYLAAA